MPSRSTSHTSSYHDQDTLATPLQHTTSVASNHSQSRLAYHRPSCQQEQCEHGLLSPHASRPTSSSSVRPPISYNPSWNSPTDSRHELQHSEASEYSQSGNGGVFGGRYAGEENLRHEILGDAVADGILGGEPGDEPPDGGGEDGEEARKKWKMGIQGMSTTQWLARKHGVTGRRKMYVPLIFCSRVWKSGEVNMTKGKGEICMRPEEGCLLTNMFLQVSSILFPIFELDNPIRLVLPSR